ncbi:MAG: hypothetical protein JSS68_14695 [Actinobacteria bacterium]|nr:hypothetical protein [Actinomycetota bacterium]
MAPELVAEIVAIATGAGVSPDRLMAINARTEILAGLGRPECSVIGVRAHRSDVGTLLAQNWDWHPDLAESLVFWVVHSEDGSSYATLTEAGILAKIGVNGHGLGVALNILGSSRDGGVEGTPIHLLLRLILAGCDGVEAVEGLLATHSTSASSAVSIAGAGPDGDFAGSFEVSPAGSVRIDDDGGLLLHTNHFLRPLAEGEDIYLRDWPDSTVRLEELRDRLRPRPRITVNDVKDALRSHRAGAIAVCCHDEANRSYPDRQGTLASVLIHPAERSIAIAAGPPCRTPYGDPIRLS